MRVKIEPLAAAPSAIHSIAQPTVGALTLLRIYKATNIPQVLSV
jgi:hypothetical protein